MALTDLKVKKLVPRNRRFEVSDGKGLSIRITPKGVKTWVFRYQYNKIPRRMTLGNYPGIGLADARQRHAEAMQDLQRGLDPGLKVKEAKAKLKAAPTMADLINELWETELQEKKSGVETLRLLQKDVIPSWGKRKVADIKRRDIVLLLDGIVKRGAPITRNRVHSALTRLFNFAAERGVIEDSPCTRIRKLAETNKSRVLTNAEIKLLWEALDLENKDIDIFWTTKMVLKMILLTGQRSGEICGMTSDEIDPDAGIWTIPATRMKNNQEHKLPLTDTVKGIIRQAYSLLGDGGPFVFRSPYRDKPLTPHSLSRAISRHRAEMGIEDHFTPHDIRRTVRTRLAELKIDEFIAERVLGHKLQGMLAVYNQYDYLPEKRKALEAWEKRLQTIVGIETVRLGNVIPFEARHG
jgi:integrase